MQFDATVAALEDKIVQRAVVTLLNAIYEEDFLGISYGFRPGRGTRLLACGASRATVERHWHCSRRSTPGSLARRELCVPRERGERGDWIISRLPSCLAS